MVLILGLTIFICILVGAAMVLFRKLIAGPKTLPVSVDWISELSVARYRPMERLLAEEDYEFLKRQPGCDAKRLGVLRQQRRRIFRGYLECLRRDFAQICAALRLMVTHSALDRPDLAGIVYKQQWLFATAMLGVECRLVLHAWGMARVDVRDLVSAMENMRLELRQMIPAESAAAA